MRTKPADIFYNVSQFFYQPCLFFVDIVFDVSTPTSKTDQHCGYADMALRVVVHPRDGETPLTITLVAQTAHEKAAWLSDLKQVSLINCY